MSTVPAQTASQLISGWGVPTVGQRLCKCCLRNNRSGDTLYTIKYDDSQKTVLYLCSYCDVPRSEE